VITVLFLGFGIFRSCLFRSGRKAGGYLLAGALRSARAKHSL
jgi:hypothetical protein